MSTLSIHLNDLRTNELDFVVGSTRDLIDEVANGQLGTLAEDVLDVSALDKLHLFDDLKNVSFCLGGLEL